MNIKITVEIITPEEAGEFLRTRNEKNRPIRDRLVRRYAADMRSGTWELTHQGVAFDAEGNLIDGQHRLQACVMSKIPLRTTVARYTSSDMADRARPMIDSSPGRDTADILVFSGDLDKKTAKEACAAVIALLTLRNGDSAGRGAANVRAALNDPDIGPCVKWAMQALPEKRFAAPVRASFALMWTAFPVEAAAFAATVREGVAERDTPAATWVRAAQSGMLNTVGGNSARVAVMRRACRIMKAYVKEEGDLKRLYTDGEAVRFFIDHADKKKKRVLRSVA